MALCECLSQKEKGAKKGIVHYEGCPCYASDYETLCKAYRDLLAAYRLGKRTPDRALAIIDRHTLD